MRIIAGEFKRRNIKTSNLYQLRPATDRYRETLFNILNNLIDMNNKLVCDIYAGSGAIGLECISRGAKFCYFIEKNFRTAKLIQENIEILKIAERTKVLCESAEGFTKSSNLSFDLIFADPPYDDFNYEKVFINIKENNLLSDKGLLIIQRGKASLQKDTQILGREPYRIVGDDVIFIFNKEEL